MIDWIELESECDDNAACYSVASFAQLTDELRAATRYVGLRDAAARARLSGDVEIAHVFELRADRMLAALLADDYASAHAYAEGE